MGIKKYNPTSPGRRFQTSLTFDEVTRSTPEKKLTQGKTRISGRNNLGRMTMRRRGGGHKRRLRLVDFKRNKDKVPAKVATIEYDPNRSARIALLHYEDGEKRYIIAPQGLNVGDTLLSGSGIEIRVGNTMPISEIPLGTLIHNLEMRPGKGGQLVRAAGTSAQLMAKEEPYALIRFGSGEVRKIPTLCRATIGQVGNVEHESVSIGKAGRSRWLGRRPKVRGVAMNPIDHPHGGGEGKSSGGRHPVSPWGVPTKGFKTRKGKPSDKLIVKRRRGKG